MRTETLAAIEQGASINNAEVITSEQTAAFFHQAIHTIARELDPRHASTIAEVAQVEGNIWPSSEALEMLSAKDPTATEMVLEVYGEYEDQAAQAEIRRLLRRFRTKRFFKKCGRAMLNQMFSP